VVGANGNGNVMSDKRNGRFDLNPWGSSQCSASSTAVPAHIVSPDTFFPAEFHIGRISGGPPESKRRVDFLALFQLSRQAEDGCAPRRRGGQCAEQLSRGCLSGVIFQLVHYLTHLERQTCTSRSSWMHLPLDI